LWHAFLSQQEKQNNKKKKPQAYRECATCGAQHIELLAIPNEISGYLNNNNTKYGTQINTQLSNNNF